MIIYVMFNNILKYKIKFSFYLFDLYKVKCTFAIKQTLPERII